MSEDPRTPALQNLVMWVPRKGAPYLHMVWGAHRGQLEPFPGRRNSAFQRANPAPGLPPLGPSSPLVPSVMPAQWQKGRACSQSPLSDNRLQTPSPQPREPGMWLPLGHIWTCSEAARIPGTAPAQRQDPHPSRSWGNGWKPPSPGPRAAMAT